MKIVTVRLVIVIVLSFFLMSFSYSQQKQGLQPYFVSIIVSDFDRSIKWYQDVFDLELLHQVKNTEQGFKQANLWNSDFLVEVIQMENVNSPAQRVTGFFKFGFKVNNFDAWIQKLKDLKVEFNGDVVDDPYSGKKMVIVKDPDGNRIQFFSR